MQISITGEPAADIDFDAQHQDLTRALELLRVEMPYIIWEGEVTQ